MPVDLGSVGSVYVDVGADLSDLTSQLAAVSSQADQIGQQIGQHITSGIGEGLGTASGASETLNQNLQETGEAAAQATAPVSSFSDSLVGMAAVAGVAIIATQELFQGFKAFVVDSVEAYGQLELVTSSLTALTGSAQIARDVIDQLEEVAKGTIFDDIQLQKAAQSMAALGVSSAQLVPAVSAAAAAAMVTGNSFDAVSGAMERMYMTGQIQTRSLVTLGILLEDLAKTAGVSASDVKDAFEALGPQSDAALQILVETINRRSGAGAAAMKDNLLPAINAVKIEWGDLYEDFGKEISPNVKQLLETLRDVLPVIKDVALEFTKIGTTQLNDLYSGWKSLSDSIRLVGDIIKPVSDTMHSLSGVSLPSVGEFFSGTMQFVTHGEQIKGMLEFVRGGWEKVAAAVGVATGKYPDLRTALTSLDEQARGTGGGIAELNAQARANVQATADQAQKTRDAASAQREALEAQHALQLQADTLTTAIGDLDKATQSIAEAIKAKWTPAILPLTVAQNGLNTALAEQEQALRDVETAHDRLALIAYPGSTASADDLAAAQKNLNDKEAMLSSTTLTLDQAQKTLKASTEADKAIVALLDKAQQDYAAGLKLIVEPAVTSLNQAEDDLVTLREQRIQNVQDLGDAEKTLQGLYDAGVRTGKDLEAAEKAIDKARSDLKQTDTDIVAKENEIKTAREDVDKATAELKKTEDALDKLYQDTKPHLTDIETGLGNLKTARGDQLTAANNLKIAEENLDKAIKDGNTPLVDLKTATGDAETARNNLKTATENVDKAEKDLTSTFGLSKTAIDLMSGALTGTDGLNAALALTGQKTGTDLTNALTTANTALTTITTSGGNFEQTLKAQIALAQAQADKWAADHDGSIPAEMQLGLAAMTQVETDFTTNSKTRWSTLYGQISGGFEGIFAALNTAVVSGDWSSFVGTVESDLKKMGTDVLTAFVQPAEDAIKRFLTGAITDLLTGTGSLKDLWHNLGSDISGVFNSSGASGALIPGFGGQMPPIGPAGPGVYQGGTPGAPTGGGSGGTGGSTGGMGGFLGAFNAVTGAVSAVTGVLSLFGVGQEGQKDRLNLISDHTAGTVAALVIPGGIFDSTADAAHMLHLVNDELVKGSIANNIADIQFDMHAGLEHLAAMRNVLLPDIRYYAENLTTIEIPDLGRHFDSVGASITSAFSSAPAPIFNIRVQIGQQELEDILVTIMADAGGNP